MKIMFDKYIDNPAGKGTVITNRSMYKQMYKDKFSKVMVREQGKIEYKLYKDNDKFDSHYIYFKIPSEVVPDFYYDVVIQFYTDNNAFKNEASLRRYYVKFYSNDPAFVYTFAHSFIKNELFIEDLKPKMAKEAVKKVAKEKNPKNDVWYVKSLFFAYLAIEKYGLFSKVKYSGMNYEKYDKKKLLSKITQAEIKIKDRQNAAEELRKNKEDTKKNPVDRNAGIRTKVSDNAGTVKKTKVVGEVKTVKSAKTTKTTSARRKR